MKRLTQTVHEFVTATLTDGDVAIDATAGNGHDTVFLASCVGPSGFVYAFDIQEKAIQQTRERIDEQGITNILLAQRSHSELGEVIADKHVGQIGAITFNLGYLPGGDKSVITTTSTTLRAVRSALELLRPGGIITVVVYPGHPGGSEEAAAVEQLLLQLPTGDFSVQTLLAEVERSDVPRLITVKKQLEKDGAFNS